MNMIKAQTRADNLWRQFIWLIHVMYKECVHRFNIWHVCSLLVAEACTPHVKLLEMQSQKNGSSEQLSITSNFVTARRKSMRGDRSSRPWEFEWKRSLLNCVILNLLLDAIKTPNKTQKYVKMFNLKISQRSEQINFTLSLHKNLIAGYKTMKFHNSK